MGPGFSSMSLISKRGMELVAGKVSLQVENGPDGQACVVRA